MRDLKKIKEAWEKTKEYCSQMEKEGRLGELEKELVPPDGYYFKKPLVLKELTEEDLEIIERDLGINVASLEKSEKVSTFLNAENEEK